MVIAVSGGGIAAAVWTAMCLDRLTTTIPDFPYHVRVITGASGGMIAAAYFAAALQPTNPTTQPRKDGDDDEPSVERTANNNRKEPDNFPQGVKLVDDLANDVLSPVASHIALAGLPSLLMPWHTSLDRGRVLEEAWEKNTRGILATPFSALAGGEQEGWRPSLIITPTIVEEGRPLIISNLDLDYMSQFEFFKMFQRAGHFRLSTALRMNAAFPFVTPASVLPTSPPRRVVDAGYLDNYGITAAQTWIATHEEWLANNTSGVILIQIRACPLFSGDQQNPSAYIHNAASKEQHRPWKATQQHDSKP